MPGDVKKLLTELKNGLKKYTKINKKALTLSITAGRFALMSLLKKTLFNTKDTTPLATLRVLNDAGGTKCPKEFLGGFSKILIFRANNL